MKRLEQIKFNMRLSLIIKTFLLLTLFSTNAFSQGQPTTQGKEFWVSFGRNAVSPGVVTVQVRLVATTTSNVTFSFTENSSYNKTFTVIAGQALTYEFTEQEMALIYHDVITTQKTNKSLRVTSDADITVYAINVRSASTDATIVLPVNNYGTSYFALSYRATSYGDGYTIIANEDGTVISEDGSVVETLSRGQVYSFYGGNNIDLTGRNLTSNKPFAMFTTNAGTQVPYNVPAADCLFQQLIPVQSWGNTFLVPVTSSSYYGRDRDRVRIIASQDGTTITRVGGTVKTDISGSPNVVTSLASPLNAGQFVELEISLAESGCFIQTNKPVAVASYLVGTHNFGYTSIGDPAMAWIPPIEQNVTSSAIAPFFAVGSSVLRNDSHYALIVTPTATKGNTRVRIGSGSLQPLSNGSWTDNAASGYSFYSMNFPSTNNNTYHFENSAGFTILGYGFGNAESYYYLAAASTRKLDAAFYVNDVHFQDVDGYSFCDNSYTIRAEVQFPMSASAGRIKWFIDGVEILSARDLPQFDTQILAVGTHTIRMVVLSVNNDVVEVQSSLTVSGALMPGSIGSDQSITPSTTPAALTSTTPASGAGTITYQWQSSTSGISWTNISGATSTTYAPGALSGTTYYRRAATNTCGTVYTASVQITVAAVGADIITANGTTICSGEVAALSASANSVAGAIFRWYNAATGGSLIHTGATYNPSPSSTTTYHVSVSGTSLSESSRKAVTVTVKPTATPDMIKITQ